MSLQNPMNKGVYLGQVINGVLNVGGSVAFYDAGTTNPATIYTDPGLTVPYPSPGNIAPLNASGYAVIYLANQAYKYVESDSQGNPVFYQDNFVGGTSGTGFGGAFVDNIAALKTLDTNLYAFAYVAGYYDPNDGGDGVFFNTTSASPDDGGYTIKSTFDATKNWNRINDINGYVRAASFGYTPQKNGSGDQTQELQNADAYNATLESGVLLIDAGTGATISSVALFSSVVKFQPGSQLIATSTATVVFNGLVEAYGNDNNQTSVGAGIFPIFGSGITAVLCSRQTSYAEWFGANTNSPDNTTAMAAWIAAGAGVFVLSPGAWNYADPTTFPWPQVPVILNGTLVGVSVTYPVGLRLPDLSAIRLNEIILQNGIILGNYSTTGLQVNGTLNIIGATTGNANISTVGPFDIISGRNIQATNEVIAGNNLLVTGNVVVDTVTRISGAGAFTPTTVTASSYVIATIGTGSGTAKTSGQSVYNASGTAPIAANSLITAGDRLSFVCAGTASGISNGSTFTVTLGTHGLFSINTSGAFTQWSMRGEIIYESSTAIRGTADLITTQPESLVETAITVTAAPSASQNLVVAAVNGGGSGTITAEMIVTQIFNM